MILLILLYSMVSMVSVSCQKNPNFVENRTVIVHLFEWKFSDVERECTNFLGPNGFGGIQLSPIQENRIIDGRPWTERYQPVSYHIDSRSGDDLEFAEMVKKCNDMKVRVYVDVVLNHMAGGNGEIFGTGGTLADPVKLIYPRIPYNGLEFHKKCDIKNIRNATEVKNCRLTGLPDLDQSNTYVRDVLVTFLNKLISFGVAGFRINASENMDPKDLEVIFARLKNCIFHPKCRPFIYHEVKGFEVVLPDDFIKLGTITEFKYAVEISDAFSGMRTLHSLLGLGPKHGLLPSENSIVFIDSHERINPRVLTFKNSTKYKMAVAFMLAHPYGQPILLSSYNFTKPNQGPPMDDLEFILNQESDKEGQCKNNWICEHRWQIFKRMVKFRNIVGTQKVSNWADNGQQQLAFCRGDKGFIAFNNEQYEFKARLHVGVPPGVYCDIISGDLVKNNCTGTKITVDKDRKAQIIVPSTKKRGEGVMAFHVESKISELKIADVESEDNSDEDIIVILNADDSDYSIELIEKVI